MGKKKIKISISKILILSNCLIMAAFFSISYFYTQRSYQSIMEREMEGKQYQMLVYISDNLNERMNTIEMLARTTANNSNIINNILYYTENKNSYEQMVFQNNMNQNLSTVAYSSPDIVSVNILMDDENLKTTQINGVYHYDNYAEDGSVDQIRNMLSGWVTTRENKFCIERYAESIISTYVMKIYSERYYGEGIGHLVVNINEKLFYDQIQKYHQNEYAEILFVDDEGKIITSTDRTAVGKALSETPYEKYRQIMDGEREEDREAKTMIYNKKQLSGRKYYVMAVADYEKMIASFRDTQSAVKIFSIALLLVFLAFSGYFAYMISKPLLKLSKEVEKFKGEGRIYRSRHDNLIYEIDVLDKGFEHMTQRIDELIKGLLEQERTKQRQELEILQAQINPHFLYNTLEAINWMALSMKQKEISRMVVLLGNFLRLSLNKGKTLYFVKDELNHLKSYIDIQNIRCKGKIIFSMEVEDELLDYKMVKLLLQPIVENSILHGFDSTGGAGQVWVKIFEEEDYLYFTVTDDGCGMKPELVESIMDPQSEMGHGIKNVMKRIQLYYGDSCGITIHSTPQIGTTVEIKIMNEVPNQLGL